MLGLGVASSLALPPHRRGLGFGIKQSAIPLAIMVVGLAAPVAARVGWRATFATTACLGLVALSYAALRPVAPRSGPGRGDTDDSPSHGGPPAEES